jgi:hypothetical protein
MRSARAEAKEGEGEGEGVNVVSSMPVPAVKQSAALSAIVSNSGGQENKTQKKTASSESPSSRIYNDVDR